MPTTGIALFPEPSPYWSWPATRTPKFGQRRQRSTSGRELRVLDQLFPNYEWVLTYEILKDVDDTRTFSSPFQGLQELYKMMGFYNAMQGSFGPFLFYDPTDGHVTNLGIGTGDGTTVIFGLNRGLISSGIAEPVHAAIFNEDTQLTVLTGLSPSQCPFNLYVNGVLQTYTTDYTVIQHNNWGNAIYAVHFTSAPAAAAAITVDMTYLWPCHFTDDSVDFENFLINRWSLKQLKISSFLLDQEALGL